MSNFKSNSFTNAFRRDVYLAYLIEGARRTKPDGYPIIEGWMIEKNVPLNLAQWDKRNSVSDPKHTGMSFYCIDPALTPVLNHPDKYVEKLRQYQCVVGMDASPYDNMPLVVQKSQIYLNLGITYYYGKQGIKIIPNVRVGTTETLSSLAAYPHNHLIAIGTNGFTRDKTNRIIFKEQVTTIIDTLDPSGILVYGPATDYIFEEAIKKQIPLYQYDSYMMIKNHNVAKSRRAGETDER